MLEGGDGLEKKELGDPAAALLLRGSSYGRIASYLLVVFPLPATLGLFFLVNN